MPNFKSVESVLDFALKNEQESVDLYGHMAQESRNAEARAFFMELQNEEIHHKKKILEMKNKKQLDGAAEKITDLKISDYLPDIQLEKTFDYQQALVYAIKAEKAEFRLYMDIAKQVGDENVKNILLILAQEEAKHKVKLEIEYDDNVLKED
jgi:rubrerythrin